MVGGDYVLLFIQTVVAATLGSGIALWVYLYFSDGPVFTSDESVVDSDD
jgi:hypothetical protein